MKRSRIINRGIAILGAISTGSFLAAAVLDAQSGLEPKTKDTITTNTIRTNIGEYYVFTTNVIRWDFHVPKEVTDWLKLMAGTNWRTIRVVSNGVVQIY